MLMHHYFLSICMSFVHGTALATTMQLAKQRIFFNKNLNTFMYTVKRILTTFMYTVKRILNTFMYTVKRIFTTFMYTVKRIFTTFMYTVFVCLFVCLLSAKNKQYKTVI